MVNFKSTEETGNKGNILYLYSSNNLNKAEIVGKLKNENILPHEPHHEIGIVAHNKKGTNKHFEDEKELSNKKLTSHQITFEGEKYYHYEYEVIKTS